MPPSGEESAGPGRSLSARAWLEAVRDAERRGELLAAFDLAGRGLEDHPGDPGLRYRAVLALARAGSTAQAARQFDELGLSSIGTEDVEALGARIRKDRALSAMGRERRRLAKVAADAYQDIRARTNGYFPAVNAATMSLVAGRPAEARALAADALALVEASGETGYFASATRAESYLLLGDEPGARAALERAAELQDGDFGALSTTRRQLRMICDLIGIDAEILSPLAGPAVTHFCGHMIGAPGSGGRFPSEHEAAVAARMADVVHRKAVGFAYGSLANGGDIMWAELLTASGSELHVVLPFALEEFITTSVAPAGDEWVERFRRCLAAAESVTYATADAYLNDDVLYAYCARLAMGLALTRARHLDAEVFQLALWDGAPASGPAGTATDVAAWRRTGHQLMSVSPQPAEGPAHGTAQVGVRSEPAVTTDRSRRVIRAMLFGDVRGFSKLTDEQLPAFAGVVLGAMADVLAAHAAEIDFRNTWGDALYAVFSGAPPAARCALDLQEALARLDLEGNGLPPDLGFRLSGHLGPVFPMRDPIVDAQTFMGSHVSRTARIEPVTPPGAVYVTEAFVASLELSGCDDIGCDYVGHMPAAKDYGRLRMYRIGRR